MSKRPLNDYFEQAKSLPLATSYASIEKLVSLKGVSTAPPKKWWWNLNNLIIMTSISSIISLTAIYFLSPEPSPEYHNRMLPSTFLASSGETISSPHFSWSEKEITRPHEVVKAADLIENTDPIWEEADQPIPMEDILEEMATIEAEEALFKEETSITTEKVIADSTVEKAESIEEGIKKINRNLSSDGVKKFILKNSKGDIHIHAWDKKAIELQVDVKVKTKKKDNESIALEDFDLQLVKSSDEVKVESNWEDIYSCMCSGSSKKDQIKTAKGDKFRVKELNFVYHVYLPNNIALELSNSYADIHMPDWTADLKVRVFHAELKGGAVQNLEVSNSYGKVYLSNFIEARGKLFQGEMTLGNGKMIDLGANYSTLQIGEVASADLDAFQSNANFVAIADRLSTNFRYGKLAVESPLKEAVIRAFQTKISADDIDQLNMNFSYSKLEAKNIQKLRIENAFQSNLSLEELGEVSGSLKYTPFKATTLKDRLDLTTFQSKVKIDEVHPQFSQLKLNSKYTELDFKLGANSSYKMHLVSNYATLNLPDFENSITESGASRKEINTVHNPKSEGETLSALDFNLFQGSLKLAN